MNIIYLNIAGFNLKICFKNKKPRNLRYYSSYSLRTEILKYYKGFILKGKPKVIHFTIELYKSPFQIIFKSVQDKNNKYLLYYQERGNLIQTFQHLSIIEFNLISKYVLQKLLSLHKGLILHASAAYFPRGSVIFIGRPNAGKSTIITLLKNVSLPLADDSVFIRQIGRDFYCYQTPFVEKINWFQKKKGRYKIRAICLIKKSYSSTKLEKITSKTNILVKISNELWSDVKHSSSQLLSLTRFINSFDEFYLLRFTKNGRELLEQLSRITFIITADFFAKTRGTTASATIIRNTTGTALT
ncbi:hypothetical protein A2153_03460 [Candidatus Gottesmanbacteria bacterium RBG_16_38_7b]|uniref:Uncharacterized protein n=2 Tax=Candidatus Gottesmaniibacteriota TaxID=1752720 RepID=A0A1F5YFJ0_9BACT|nr:MAG: hypothetical protein A2153_03460 [Candidatus Gottesmanbacteria bacterium RBG_16_38_7b]OGG30969.1 MAG: hypothetical protein A3I51_02285 [Candidatus Gottesmanbacteria bacterium RIFCSPLOWO2_02_FULL_38_8]